jgi:RND family efflux transporter MFP subunit
MKITKYLAINNGLIMFKKISISPMRVLSAFVLVTLLNGCSDAPEETQIKQVVQAVKLVEVTRTPESRVRTFPAEVTAVKTIDVSFEVNGRLQNTNLQTGALIKKGEVLAQIDPTPFNQTVNEAKTRLTQAQRNLDRISATFAKQLASQSEMDAAITDFELAEIALQRAQQDLGYTTLLSPFDAQLSERLVDNDSYIRAGDIIARLQDISRYYFVINVPERLFSQYTMDSLLAAKGFLISAPEQIFTLEYIEHDTQPDPVTQTYKVVFSTSEKNEKLTPGARAVVEVTIGAKPFADTLLVPFTAIEGNDNDGFHVWRFDETSQTVTSAAVDIIHIEDSLAVVKGDLAVGELVVAAGANKMREGLTVKPYQSEQ